MDKQDCKSQNPTEQLILEAAVREFGRKGFDGARTTNIAAEAGVTHAMLNYYFRTKENLFERIFEDKLSQILDLVLAPITESSGDIKQRIAKGIAAHFDFLMANRDLPRFIVTNFNARPDYCRKMIDNIESNARERLMAFQEQLDQAYFHRKINHINAWSLLGDIASLNVFPFLAFPMMMAISGYDSDCYDEFMQARKEENIETIMKRLS